MHQFVCSILKMCLPIIFFVWQNRKIYKSSRYEYSSSKSGGKGTGTGTGTGKSYESVEPTNVNQLDNLLDDLKQERTVTYDKGNTQTNSFLNEFSIFTVYFDCSYFVCMWNRCWHRPRIAVSIFEKKKKQNENDAFDFDRNLFLCADSIYIFFFQPCSEPNSRVTKTSRTVTTSGGSKPVNRELKFDSPSLVSSVNQTRGRSRSPNYQDNVESQIMRDVKYDTEPVLDTTPNSTMSRSYNYSKTSSSSRNVTPYDTKIVEMDTTDLPVELKDVPISSDLLPGPGTKVTTTVNSINSISIGTKTSPFFSILLFYSFVYRLKRSHMKFRMTQKFRQIKISTSKMNSIIRRIHQTLIIRNVMCHRHQQNPLCIQMSRIIRWIERKIFIHHRKIRLDQIKPTIIKRKSMKQRIMCTVHQDHHGHHHQSIHQHRYTNEMYRIHEMSIIHPVVFQFIQIMPIYRHINRAPNKHTYIKRKQPTPQTQCLNHQLEKNICHMIDMWQMRRHLRNQSQINIINIHHLPPQQIHTIGQNVNHYWLHSQPMAFINQLKSMDHQNILANWWLHLMR